MLLSITNIKREYNIRDCEPIIHCIIGSWFRFPKNLFHSYVYHNGKILWKSYVIVFKTDDPSWWKQLMYDFAISLYAVLPQLGICVVFCHPLSTEVHKNILWKRLSLFIHI